ncbi:MAG: MATE family efflux transporter [Clostridia bacterium]|nr:MATE family efflux transporter [Clostridia bacterium]
MRWITKDKNFYKTVLRLAIPISLQALVTFLVGFADNVMVATLGDAAVSGVAFGGQVQFFLQQIIVGMGSALMIMTARYWGQKEPAPIRRLVGLVLRLGGTVALLMTALSLLFPRQLLGLFTNQQASLEEGTAYLRILCLSFLFYAVSQLLTFAMRSVETAQIGAIASVAAMGVNVLLNWLLIFGVGPIPRLGVRGAAIATLVSRGVECTVIFFYVFCLDKKLKMRLREIFASSEGLWKQYLRFGLPVIAGDLVWAVNILFQNALLGHYTEDVSAAASVTNTLNNLIYVVLNGLWGGVSVLIGKTIGEGKRETVKEYARTCQLLFLGVGLAAGAVVFFGKEPFLRLYGGISEDARSVALTFMSVLSVTIIGTCYQACCLGSLVKAGGDTSFVFKNDSIFVFLVVLPSAFLASYFGAPLWVVFLCLKCDQILKCIVAVVKVNRYRWIKALC